MTVEIPLRPEPKPILNTVGWPPGNSDCTRYHPRDFSLVRNVTENSVEFLLKRLEGKYGYMEEEEDEEEEEEEEEKRRQKKKKR